MGKWISRVVGSLHVSIQRYDSLTMTAECYCARHLSVFCCITTKFWLAGDAELYTQQGTMSRAGCTAKSVSSTMTKGQWMSARLTVVLQVQQHTCYVVMEMGYVSAESFTSWAHVKLSLGASSVQTPPVAPGVAVGVAAEVAAGVAATEADVMTGVAAGVQELQLWWQQQWGMVKGNVIH